MSYLYIWASIPSPSSGSLHLGPLRMNAYGLMIALGVVAAVWLTGKRVEARGVATGEDIGSIAMWAVPAGVVGARLYHVVTDWSRFSHHYGDIIKVWEGGLGIWGGIALGAIVGMWAARHHGLRVLPILTCAAPALAIAQAIGRWGNWFNQELFGKATSLPWALQISADKTLSAGFPVGTTFHPTFLYESLGCALLCWVLLLVDKKVPLRPGRLFFVYSAGYTLMRFFIEGLRIDEAHHVGGLRLNQWVSLTVFVISIGFLVQEALWSRRSEPDPSNVLP
ncbi:MAG: prolipoprotein diacylglyceryl transferase, partial [Actinomycetes bacterium]